MDDNHPPIITVYTIPAVEYYRADKVHQLLTDEVAKARQIRDYCAQRKLACGMMRSLPMTEKANAYQDIINQLEAHFPEIA